MTIYLICTDTHHILQTESQHQIPDKYLNEMEKLLSLLNELKSEQLDELLLSNLIKCKPTLVWQQIKYNSLNETKSFEIVDLSYFCRRCLGIELDYHVKTPCLISETSKILSPTPDLYCILMQSLSILRVNEREHV